MAFFTPQRNLRLKLAEEPKSDVESSWHIFAARFQPDCLKCDEKIDILNIQADSK